MIDGNQYKSPTQITQDSINLLRRLYVEGLTVNTSATLDSTTLAREGTLQELRNYISDIYDKLDDDSINVIASIASPTSLGIVKNTSISNVTATQITASSTPCKYVILSAPHTNTGRITVGGTTVTDGYGICILYPTDNSIRIDISNVNLLYAIAEINGEDVSVTWFN